MTLNPHMGDNLEAALGFLQTTGLQFNDTGTFDSAGFLPIVLCLLWTFLAPNTQEVLGQVEHSVGPRLRWTWRPNRRWALFTAVLTLLAFIRLREVSEFIYFQF